MIKYNFTGGFFSLIGNDLIVFSRTEKGNLSPHILNIPDYFNTIIKDNLTGKLKIGVSAPNNAFDFGPNIALDLQATLGIINLIETHSVNLKLPVLIKTFLLNSGYIEIYLKNNNFYTFSNHTDLQALNNFALMELVDVNSDDIFYKTYISHSKNIKNNARIFIDKTSENIKYTKKDNIFSYSGNIFVSKYSCAVFVQHFPIETYIAASDINIRPLKGSTFITS